MARCRALARVQRQRAYAGTSRPQIVPVARPRFDKRTVLEVLKDRGAEAQQEIMQDSGASEPAEMLRADLAAAVAMAARRATTKASRPAAKRSREARQAPSALAKRRAKRARKEVRWASGYTIPARLRADDSDGEMSADEGGTAGSTTEQQREASSGSERAIYEDVESLGVFLSEPPVPLFGRAAEAAAAQAAEQARYVPVEIAPPTAIPLTFGTPIGMPEGPLPFVAFGRAVAAAEAAPAAAAGSERAAAGEGSEAFAGEEEVQEAKKAKVVEDILSTIPHSWDHLLYTFGQTPALSAAKRRVRARNRLLKASPGQCANMRRALKSLVPYVAEDEDVRAALLERGSLPPDASISFLEDYDEAAQARAEQRAAKRAKSGLPPRRNDRGGRTAAMPVWLGLEGCRKRLGLPFHCDSESVKEVARCGAGMPAVQPMVNLLDVRSMERTTVDPSASEFERAYAGGGWLTVASSTRVVDLQRTPQIRFERSSVLGSDTVIACGVARKSKARSRMQMKPLPWRAAVISIGGGEVDLQPLVQSMPDSDAGCVFRDFVVPPGVPHVIGNATAWASRPASHETVVKSLRQITGNDELGGHNGRHVLPEVARGLQLPKQMREALGYWRQQPTIGDPSDAAAVAQALTKARQRQTRAGALASCADRYSSVDAAPVEQDQARVACMLAARALFESGEPPETSRAQIEAIATAQQQA